MSVFSFVISVIESVGDGGSTTHVHVGGKELLKLTMPVRNGH